MPTYRTLDGERFDVASPDDLVREMRRTSRSPSADAAEFMRQVADRCRLYNNAVVRAGLASDFVTDLLSCGYLQEEN